jgi:hypothetical protein
MYFATAPHHELARRVPLQSPLATIPRRLARARARQGAELVANVGTGTFMTAIERFVSLRGRLPAPDTLAKCCALILALLLPGSFIVLPALWLARRRNVADSALPRIER